MDRRRTVRIPAGARLLLRAVGMTDYVLCEVSSVSTLSLELSLDRALPTGTVATVLVLQEGRSKAYRRAIGSVERRERKSGRWVHLVRASSKKPWSTMFIYDVVYQAIVASWFRTGSEFDLLSLENDNPVRQLEDEDPVILPAPGLGSARPPADSAASGADRQLLVYRALAWFSPFRELNDFMRQLIAREQRLSSAPAGTTLIERGSDDDVSIFLVAGVVEIEAFDGRKINVVAGTAAAQFPISLLRPHACTVRAVTDVTVMLLDQQMVREIAETAASYRNRLGIEVSEHSQAPGNDTARDWDAGERQGGYQNTEYPAANSK